MKEQMHEILMNLNRGRITVSEAQEQLLDLFDVSGSAFIANSDNKRLIVVATTIDEAVDCLERNGYSSKTTIEYAPYKCLLHYR